jgi:type VI protein secretion system component VasK
MMGKVGKGLLFGLLAMIILIALLGVCIGEKEQHPILAIGLITLFILCMITAMLLRHLRLKRQQDIDILNADVSKISDDEAVRLAKKYRR